MDTYTTKEEARMALQSALETYHKAADADGLDFCDMAGEIEDARSEVGIKVDVIPS